MLNSHSQFSFGVCGLLILSAAGIWRLTRWVQQSPKRPDPWDADVEMSLQAAEAVPVCRHCFAPQIEHVHFCRECGTSVGDYNNLLPYINLFSVGESFRTGSSGKYRVTPLTKVGYFVCAMTEYSLFAPVYWFFLFRNAKKISTENEQTVEDSESSASL